VSIAEWILWIVSLAMFVFFVLYSIATLALIGLSLLETTLIKVERGELFSPPQRRRRPGITLVVPAYNMEPLVVASVRSFLASDYEPLEVVVVDDGSDDGTGETLAKAFDLVELPTGDRLQIPTAPITAIHVSRTDPRLRVVCKKNGGRSDAINAGLNVARKPLVALIDADSLLEPDALTRVEEVFAADPDRVVGVGGTIRIANGAVIEHGAVTSPRVSARGVEATQTGEYFRGFLGTRIAWSRINGLLIISGAFGVFHTDLVRESGGLSKDTLGEDMELVMRLHHQLRPSRPETRLAYAADANAWTEVPPGLKPLRGQRIRWHVGIAGQPAHSPEDDPPAPFRLGRPPRAPVHAPVRGARAAPAGGGLRDPDRAHPLRHGLLVVRRRVRRRRAARGTAADRGRNPGRGDRLQAVPHRRPHAACGLVSAGALLVQAADGGLAGVGDRDRAPGPAAPAGDRSRAGSRSERPTSRKASSCLRRCRASKENPQRRTHRKAIFTTYSRFTFASSLSHLRLEGSPEFDH
jgi:glycosyltransferase involved in cell wall biosynthesis